MNPLRFIKRLSADSHRPPRALWAGVAAIFLIGGCTVGPNYQAPDQAMPAHWESVPTTQATVIDEHSAQSPEKWWQTFQDAMLNSLVDRALASNLDLQAATQRIRQARGALGIVRAGQSPNINVNSAYTVSGTGNSGTGELWRGGLDASWELDIFGGVRRSVEAARADLQATIEDRRDVALTLLGEVASDYFQLRSYQQQLIIADANLKAQVRNASLTREKKRLGTGTDLDIAQADAQVATTRADIAAIETLRQQAVYSLSLLLALPPTALDAELATVGPIPSPPQILAVGVPSELLRRRPDIRRAERTLASATAQIGVATSDLFPRFFLAAGLGTESGRFTSLVNGRSGFWSIGPSVSWPLFDAGRIRSNIEVQNALQAQALTAYQKTVLTALQEVQNALVALARDRQRSQALSQAVEANQRAVALATRRYNQGVTDFLSVLDAQRSLLASQQSLVESERSVSLDAVALYKALGGGWNAAEDASPPAKAN